MADKKERKVKEEPVKKEPPVKVVKMPSFTRLFIGGLMAYWLSTIMNPAFVAIGALLILLIPVLSVDNIFAKQFIRAYFPPPKIEPKVMSKNEYREMKIAEEEAAELIRNPPPPPPKQNILKEQ